MAINYKDENGVIHSLIPDMNNIDDAAASSSTTYSSSKTNQLLSGKQNVEEGKGLSSNDFTDDDKTAILNSPIPSTSTTSPLTDSANGYLQGVTVKGHSRKTKNLLEITATTQEVNGVTFTVNSDGTIKANGTASDIATITIGNINAISGVNYVITGAPKSYSNTYRIWTHSDAAFPVGHRCTTDEHLGEGVPIEALATENCTVIIQVFPGTTLSAFVFKPMFCTSADYEADPTFEPYFEGIKSVGDDGLTVTTANSDNTVTTSAEITTALPLRSVSDTVRDKLTCTAEKKQVETLCDRVKLADLTWTEKRQAGDIYVFISRTPQETNSLNGLCNKYTVELQSAANLMPNKSLMTFSRWWSSTKYLIVRDDDYTTIEDFVASLGDAELVYELAEPITTPLTDAEISAFRSLRTYDDTTNITISDDPEFEFDYLKNSDNGQAVADVQKDLQGQIDDLNSKTDILESKIDLLESKSEHFVYAYVIDHDDSNPATCVQPYYNTKYGCDNLLYTPAYMDYSTNKFNYGSWESFVKRIAKPCMLHYDGHVDYYLDPDDYSKKLDGGDSDIADMNYEGNVMVELERLYFKRWTANRKSYVIISDQKLDKSFKAFAHHDVNGKPAEYIYRAVYDGAYDGTRLRSISGIDYHNADALTIGKIMSNTTREEEMNYAKANNTSTEKGEGWFILHKAEWDYINDILVLIGMSTDTQTVFGRGRDSGYVSSTNTGIISTGTMDDKGLFWGENAGAGGVKVLGFENHWGNLMKSCAGWNLVNGEQKTKMTYGTEDYSADTGFNTDASGYPTTTPSTPSGTNGGYISNWITGESGFIPLVASGSALTYRTDGLWFVNNANCFALVGGFSGFGKLCGATAVSLHDPATYRGWSIGATLTYKTLA